MMVHQSEGHKSILIEYKFSTALDFVRKTIQEINNWSVGKESNEGVKLTIPKVRHGISRLRTKAAAL
jgi:hypothetical protein